MGNNGIFVSIGLPVYNGEKYLGEALDSILSQSFGNFELIISDNASTDNTEKICKRYMAEDKRIRYYRNEKNLGAAMNYNCVFELSNGEYFKWASYDDKLAPTFLERCVSVLSEDDSIALCYPKTVIIDEHGRRLKNYFDDYNFNYPGAYERFKHFIFSSSGECNAIFGLIRANVLKQTPLIGNFAASDMNLLAELALLGKFYEVPENLFFRRDHPKTSIRANKDSQKNTDIYACTLWFDPAREGKIQLNRWRWLFEYLRSIKRIKMSLHDKLSCFLLMGRWFWWKKASLKEELKTAVKQILFRYRKLYNSFYLKVSSRSHL